MPLPLTVSCFTKIQTGFTFLVLAHPGSPGQRAIKRVCVCVFLSSIKKDAPKRKLVHFFLPHGVVVVVIAEVVVISLVLSYVKVPG